MAARKGTASGDAGAAGLLPLRELQQAGSCLLSYRQDVARHCTQSRLKMARTLPLPVDDMPFWLRAGNPLANYQSAQRLPTHADVVVIGAGLTGAATAYHLSQEPGQRVIVLDQGDPAGEASGRNGGNFELIPENSVGAYEGLAKERFDFLRRRYRGLAQEIVRAESQRQASVVLGVALRNRDLLKNIILREGIDCDFSPRGWLHLACNEH